MGVLIHLESNNLKKGQKKIALPDAKRYAVCGMNDKNNPLPRVNTPLFSPEDPEFGFSSGSSGPSRRKFLKRTGGATMGTLISWQASSQKARAKVDEFSATGSMIPAEGEELRNWKIKVTEVNISEDSEGNRLGGVLGFWDDDGVPSTPGIDHRRHLTMSAYCEESDWLLEVTCNIEIRIIESAEVEKNPQNEPDVWTLLEKEEFEEDYKGTDRSEASVWVQIVKSIDKDSGEVSHISRKVLRWNEETEVFEAQNTSFPLEFSDTIDGINLTVEFTEKNDPKSDIVGVKWGMNNDPAPNAEFFKIDPIFKTRAFTKVVAQ